MRRTMGRFLILAVFLGALAFLATQCGVRSYEPPRMQVKPGVEVPRLTSLEVVDVVFEPENGRITLALEITEDATAGGLIGDSLELYRWARGYYLPIKCGEGYPPELCKVGMTEMYFLQRKPIQVIGGTAEGYVVLWVMGLDQVQIDRLLASAEATPPETLQELFTYHDTVYQETQGTGGYFQFFQDPPPYPGLR